MNYPKQLYVYVCDYDKDTTPIYAVARTLDEIPEDQNGETLAIYTRTYQSKLTVKKAILSTKP